MKVLDLICSYGHRFEAWFKSEQEYQLQVDSGFLVCPMCGDGKIHKLPSAPRLNLSGSDSQEKTNSNDPSAGSLHNSTNSTDSSQSLEQLVASEWLKSARRVLDSTEDVGQNFTDQARKIHHKEIPERAIRGIASPQDVQELKEEGIPIMAIPVPEHLKKPLH